MSSQWICPLTLFGCKNLSVSTLLFPVFPVLSWVRYSHEIGWNSTEMLRTCDGTVVPKLFKCSTYWDILWVPESGPGSPSSLSSEVRFLGYKAGGRGCCLQLLLVERRNKKIKKRITTSFANFTSCYSKTNLKNLIKHQRSSVLDIIGSKITMTNQDQNL